MEELFGEDVVVGRSPSDLKKYGKRGAGFLGRVVMSRGEEPVLGRRVYIDLTRPHVMLICGKRGYGKSYTLGVLMEEFARLPEAVKIRTSVIAIDTVGIFWTLKLPNREQEKELRQWGLEPRGFDVRVLVPKGKLSFYKKAEIPVDGAFALSISDISDEEWLALFGLSWKEPVGVAISEAIRLLREKKISYGFEEIKETILSLDYPEEVKKAAVSRFEVAEGWGLFDREGLTVPDLARPGAITIIDVSTYRQSVGMEGLREIVVAVIGKKLFEERMMYRKVEEMEAIKGRGRVSRMPVVWLLIDEAHMFMPKDRPSLAKDVLLEWVRVGRQPGLSLVLATQRPNKIHEDAISQCDLFISHRLTSEPDIKAVSVLRPTYLLQDLGKYFGELPRSKGFAIIIDDNSEKMYIIKVRPRMSWHGGGTATAMPF